MTEYDYTKTPCDIGRLTQEVQKSNIVTALDSMTLFGSALQIFFKADLSDADKTTLDVLVTAHTGVPLPYGPQPVTVTAAPTPPPFAAKVIGAKGLFKRITGIQSTLVQGSNDILFTVPYNWAKITGLEIIGSEANDIVSMYVLDSTTGTYSGHNNYQLNQFGFSVNLPKDYYAYKSEFDADLYINMQIKVSYTSASAKTVGINFILNEVK